MFDGRLKQAIIDTHVHSSPVMYAEYKVAHKKVDDYPSSPLPYAVNKLPMSLPATVIPKASILCSRLKSLRLGGQQVITSCESCVIERTRRCIYTG